MLKKRQKHQNYVEKPLCFPSRKAKKAKIFVNIAQKQKRNFVKIFVKNFIFFLKKYCIFKYFNV